MVKEEWSSYNPDATGVMLVNLGCPASPSPRDIRRFLGQFLGDRRVVELPRWAWLPLLHGLILPLRSRRLARSYLPLYQDGALPLRAIVERQTRRLGERLPFPVVMAMTYGRPAIPEGLDKLVSRGCERILILPLFPQFSATTAGPVYDQVGRWTARTRNIPELRIVRCYYDEPAYIEALTVQIRNHWEQHDRGEQLLFSFHGLPERCVRLGDPYLMHCQHSATAVAAKLHLESNQWQLAFQSRFGPAPWLRPYTEEVLEKMGAAGLERLDVMCPGFSADCLETLEEVKQEYAEVFQSAGGGAFHYIPCLNDQELHIEMMIAIVKRGIAGWHE